MDAAIFKLALHIFLKSSSVASSFHETTVLYFFCNSTFNCLRISAVHPDKHVSPIIFARDSFSTEQANLFTNSRKIAFSPYSYVANPFVLIAITGLSISASNSLTHAFQSVPINIGIGDPATIIKSFSIS